MEKLTTKQPAQASLDSSWADLSLLSDFMGKELVKTLEWSDVKILTAVNRSWRSLFETDSIWKHLFEEQYPFEAANVTSNYFKSFRHYYHLFNQLQCPHKETATLEGSERICPCTLDYFIKERKSDCGVARRFTGFKSEYYYCFPTWEDDDCKCSSKPTSDKVYRSFPVVCKECIDLIIKDSYVGQHLGMPEKRVQRLDAEWIHEEFVSPLKIDIIEAIPGSEKFLGLIKEPQQLVLLTFNDKQVHIEVLLQGDQLLAKSTAMQVSACGTYVAIYQQYKTKGIVFKLTNRTITFSFERGDYQVKNSSFPVTFFRHNDRTLLIAGKDWNYLEVYDPETGEELRKRETDENHLEFFWCSLEVSPDQKMAASYGWVWHPVGMIASFSLEDWMTTDIFASDKAKATLGSDFWDTAYCFINNDTLAIWSTVKLGEEAVDPKDDPYGMYLHRKKPIQGDIVLGYNVKTRHYTRLALPEVVGYGLMMDGDYLYNLSPGGIKVLDPTKNIYLEVANTMAVKIVRGYNRHSKQFISSKDSEDGSTFILSRIRWW